jgi:hypothetical protein
MKRFLINITCSLLLVSCTGNSTEKTGNTAETATVPSSSLSEKVQQIAEALPLKRDSATAFLSGLFVPSDSLQVRTDGDFKRFTGGNISLLINNLDSSIAYVKIFPATVEFLQLNLKELAPKMDSAWKDDNRFPEVKDPPLGVIGLYTDKQHRKKLVTVLGPSLAFISSDSVIREITIYANDFQ